MSLKNKWSENGYDAEELYFEKLNRELIHQLKKRAYPPQDQKPDVTHETGAKIIAFPKQDMPKKKSA